MQKVYLLLRNNKQTGPYSLEELLQLNLKAFDLVWVEGRSAAWQYPSEIPSLKPYVPETPQAEVPFQPIATSVMEEKLGQASNLNVYSQPQNPAPQKTGTPKRVFVSVPETYTSANGQKTFGNQNFTTENHKPYMPPDEEPILEKKEEIKQATALYSESFASLFNQQKTAGNGDAHTNYSHSMNEVEENYSNWVYQQKTKKKASVNPKDLVLAVLILAVIGGGYYIMSKPSVTNAASPKNEVAAQTIQQPTENVSGTPEESQPKEILSSEQKPVPNANTVSSNTGLTNTLSKKTKAKTKNPVIVSKGQANSSVPSSQTSMPVEKTNPNIHSANNDVVSREPQVKQQPKESTREKKKEKFGDMIKSIFSKKDRKEETKNNPVVVDDPKHADNRQATKREEGDNSSKDNAESNETNTTNLMEQIDLTSNAPDNWMMGVKNLKITLRNRSTATIQTATVMVNYYNENNELLEKKLVYFNNIAPKSKATAAAPDSKFADHVDFKLASANAKEDRYARF